MEWFAIYFMYVYSCIPINYSTYFDGMETTVFTCFVVSAVSVRLSVHCITTIGPLQ